MNVSNYGSDIYFVFFWKNLFFLSIGFITILMSVLSWLWVKVNKKIDLLNDEINNQDDSDTTKVLKSINDDIIVLKESLKYISEIVTDGFLDEKINKNFDKLNDKIIEIRVKVDEIAEKISRTYKNKGGLDE